MENKYKNFYKILSEMDESMRFKKFMLFMLAPVVAGYKPSSTITLVKKSNDYFEWNKSKEELLKELNLNYIVLRECSEAKIILVFNEAKLRERLKNKDNKNFLEGLNYDLSLDIFEILLKLKERYNLYHCPHELGIFLGIPVEDVKDFMECTEKKCLACGYWKVYNNYDEAIKTFNNYNLVKDRVINLVNNNNDFINIVKEIKGAA
ncbi:MAG: DUF3793 family protein [Clostridium sp.]|uniref:DUF3793 family protein n=1 Tax=Clostridium TaxID=1485 RepID=UPI0021532D8D|nr:DUF3793 family protein [Clostridium sp. LY3-2]MCR6515204.1 DUF3793 family protein [Clostridium sp. LY3-2]